MDKDSLTEATISVGGVHFRLTAEDEEAAFMMEPGYAEFVIGSSGGVGDDRVDVRLSVRREHPTVPPDGELIFDTETNWSLLRRKEKLFMPISSPAIDPRPYKMLAIESDLSAGRISMAPGAKQVNPHSSGYSEAGHVESYPFQYPLDEVLMINVLSRGRGAEIHGLGIDLGGDGIIFTGTSGAGKSTLAELWKVRGDGTILSDDRLIVRPDPADDGGGFLLYGTPWHGDAEVSAPGGVPLKRILVLNQDDDNAIEELSTSAAATMLLVRCFPTFWDHEGMEFTMDFIGRLCAAVPCYQLSFRPEQAAIDTAIASL